MDGGVDTALFSRASAPFFLRESRVHVYLRAIREKATQRVGERRRRDKVHSTLHDSFSGAFCL